MAEAVDLRCSTLTRALGESPGGTAGCWHRVVLVELPLPWPGTIEEHPLLSGVDGRAREGREHRILALASALRPDDEARDDGLRIICYHRAPEAPYDRFDRAELCAPESGVAEAVEHLLDAGDHDLDGLPADGFAAGGADVDRAVRDLVICTHGTRDRCCGKLGTQLFAALESRIPSGVRLWRTSHTGGHRFAPTGLTFPDGGTWARLDADLVLDLIARTLPAEDAARHSRGSVGIAAGPGQVADAAALGRLGWTWTDTGRLVDVDVAGDQATVVLTTAHHRYRAIVRATGRVPVPDCGNPLDAARKTTLDWELESFDEE